MASTIIAVKLGSTGPAATFKATDIISEENLQAVPTDRECKLVITVPRNLKFHKKFFVLLRVVFDYMDEGTRLRLNVHTAEELLHRLKIDLGLYSLHIIGAGSTLPEGTVVYTPDSISFDAMDEVRFDRLYKDTIGVAINKYVTNQTEDSMMQAINAVLRFE